MLKDLLVISLSSIFGILFAVLICFDDIMANISSGKTVLFLISLIIIPALFVGIYLLVYWLEEKE
jgi:hypothetical protein